jgi:energy-coupling factor transporter ATP-binding protein EcfA2
LVVVGRVLEAHGLRKAYRGTVAVDGVDLTVALGERVALLGPNGAGKTTTLLMLLGVITPDAGTVDVLGLRLPAGRSRAMELVGFAAGYLPLPDRLRVREVLGIFANLRHRRQRSPAGRIPPRPAAEQRRFVRDDHDLPARDRHGLGGSSSSARGLGRARTVDVCTSAKRFAASDS